MSDLFGRVVNIAIAPKTSAAQSALSAIESSMGFDVSNLDCAFSVKKTLKSEPNTCELKIYNLAPNTRRVLEVSDKLVLRLEAGYAGAVGQIYLGEVRSAHSHREGADIITEVTTGDAETNVGKKRINFSVGPKVSAQVALTAIARTLGVGLGNVEKMSATLAAKGQLLFGAGTLVQGYAARALDDFCWSADLEWSIQDGALQILDRGKALQAQAVLISPRTGLRGSPTIDNKGIVSVAASIQPDLLPGRKIDLESESFKGGYRIEQCEFAGDTRGGDWTVKMSCRKY